MSEAVTEAPPGPVPRGLPAVTFSDPSTIRLIAAARLEEPAMAPLADDKDDLAVLERLEGRTSPRRDREMPLPSGLRREELLTDAHGYGWTYVNAAFCYTRPGGNRFNGVDRGSWYATWGDAAEETACREIAWHLTRELANVGVYDNTTDYRELIAGFSARMADLSLSGGESFLDPDPAVGYPAGQALARELREAGIAGVVYPSVRHSAGRCLAAFRPHLVQNVRQGATWRFTWAGGPEPRLSRV